MKHRITKVYTKTGDDGTTGLGDNTRVRKDSLRIEVIGTIDEVNSLIGVVLAKIQQKDLQSVLQEVQHQLFDLGAEFAVPGSIQIDESFTKALERWLDHYQQELTPLQEFILPGGNEVAALCFYARAVARRAERILVRFAQNETINKQSLVYLNRLSDLLFVLARFINKDSHCQEVLWRGTQN